MTNWRVTIEINVSVDGETSEEALEAARPAWKAAVDAAGEHAIVVAPYGVIRIPDEVWFEKFPPGDHA